MSSSTYSPALELVVDLDRAERYIVERVGFGRQFAADEQRRRNVAGALPNRFGAHLLGAYGEAVVAKALGLDLEREWRPNVGGTDKAAGDVAGLHVRTSSSAFLVIRDRDRDLERAPFVLVTGVVPAVEADVARFLVRGWAYPYLVKRPEYRRAPRGWPPAWFIPAAELAPFDTRPFLP